MKNFDISDFTKYIFLDLIVGIVSTNSIVMAHGKQNPYLKLFYLNRYTPQLCCGWDKPSINFNRKYI
jgi:hypothetical protein